MGVVLGTSAEPHARADATDPKHNRLLSRQSVPKTLKTSCLLAQLAAFGLTNTGSGPMDRILMDFLGSTAARVFMHRRSRSGAER